MTPWFRRTFELQDPLHARMLPMEGLRGFAVTLVFLQHYTVQAQLLGLAPGATATFAAVFRAYGNYGVELFFVLSGFLIYGSLVGRAPSFGTFMARRVQRIYPTFLVVFLFALALSVLVPGADKVPPGLWPATVYLAMNLALLPGLIPMTRVVEVAWTLSFEMFFYLATAALVLGTRFGRVPAPRRAVVLGVLAAGFVVASLSAIPDFPIRMMPFFAGMLLAEGMGRRVPPPLAWAATLAGFLASATGVLPGVWNEVTQTLAFFALCAVAFRSAGAVSAWLVWTPLRWLGNMSYSYYLIHGFVVRIGMVLLARELGPGMPDWLFWTLLPVFFAVTLVASAALFIIVEKPLSLKRVVRAPRAEAATAASAPKAV